MRQLRGEGSFTAEQFLTILELFVIVRPRTMTRPPPAAQAPGRRSAIAEATLRRWLRPSAFRSIGPVKARPPVLVRSADELVFSVGVLESAFPRGRHAFPADLGSLRELKRAVRATLGEHRVLSRAELIAVASRWLALERDEEGEPRAEAAKAFFSEWSHPPFTLAPLYAFLEARRDSLLALAEPARNATLRHLRARTAYLERLGAPDPIVQHSRLLAQEVEQPTWFSNLDLRRSAPSPYREALELVHVRETLADIELVYGDLSKLIELAAELCVSPLNAVEIPRGELHELLLEPVIQRPELAAPSAGHVTIGLGWYESRLERLELGELPDGRGVLVVEACAPEEEEYGDE